MPTPIQLAIVPWSALHEACTVTVVVADTIMVETIFTIVGIVILAIFLEKTCHIGLRVGHRHCHLAEPCGAKKATTELTAEIAARARLEECSFEL
jgi:hypothetical protein